MLDINELLELEEIIKSVLVEDLERSGSINREKV